MAKPVQKGKSNTQRENVFGNIQQELRKTHFQLGNDRVLFESQYKKDYPTKETNNFGPMMDNVTLRKTHFILGDYRNNYHTSTNEQNKNVNPNGQPVAALNQELKNDLRKSHFILGNYDKVTNPTYQTNYTNRNVQGNQYKDLSEIGKSLRKHSHVLGDNRIEYRSEMQSKFINPETTGKQQQVVSTAELQKSHYVFGSRNEPWATTTQLSYGPKEVDSKLYSKNLTKTNFILGDNKMPLKSVSHQTYVHHPNQGFSQKNKELSEDLRRHHFKFGNDEPSMTSLNRQDFVERNLKDARFGATIDDQTLKKSHFSIGDVSQQTKDHYDSTYTKAMDYKGLNTRGAIPNVTYKSSINIAGKDPINYITESASK